MRARCCGAWSPPSGARRPDHGQGSAPQRSESGHARPTLAARLNTPRQPPRPATGPHGHEAKRRPAILAERDREVARLLAAHNLETSTCMHAVADRCRARLKTACAAGTVGTATTDAGNCHHGRSACHADLAKLAPWFVGFALSSSARRRGWRRRAWPNPWSGRSPTSISRGTAPSRFGSKLLSPTGAPLFARMALGGSLPRASARTAAECRSREGRSPNPRPCTVRLDLPPASTASMRLLSSRSVQSMQSCDVVRARFFSQRLASHSGFWSTRSTPTLPREMLRMIELFSAASLSS